MVYEESDDLSKFRVCSSALPCFPQDLITMSAKLCITMISMITTAMFCIHLFDDLVKDSEYNGSDLESEHESDEERIGCE